MKRFILLVVIIAIAFTACTKKSDTQQQTATVDQTANPHPEILNGDLSAFAGTWINNDKNSAMLSPDGVFNPGGWGNGLRASDFKKSGEGVNEIYSWANLIDGDGFSVTLYPIGTEVVHYDDNILITDTTRVRIAIGRVFSSDDVYYFSHAGYSGTYVNPYALIMNSDFSYFAGRWVNDHGGGSVELTPDGLLHGIGYSVSNIKKIGDAYSWDLSTGVVSMPVFPVSCRNRNNRRR